MINVFITGATGFIGKHIVEKLKQNTTVFCLCRRKTNIFEDENVKVIIGDITDKTSYEVPDNCYVFHLAARIRHTSPKEYIRVNREGTKMLLEKCAKRGVKKFVYFSSADVYGIPEKFPITEETPCYPPTYYAKSKLDGEKVVLSYDKYFPTVVIRIPAVYGPWNNRWQYSYKIFKQVKRGWFPLIGDGSNLKEFCFVKNLVEGALLCAHNRDARGKVYLISDERPYTFREIISEIAKAMNVDLRIISLPYFSGKVLGMIYPAVKKLYSEFYFDISRAKKELNYIPRWSLQDGILETIKQNNIL